jgi:hypothetical protein
LNHKKEIFGPRAGAEVPWVEKKSTKMRDAAISQLSGCSGTQQGAHDQAQIECANMNQEPLENILASPQMYSSHSARIVTVREVPLDQLPSLPQ